jgi:hypothetical protein
MRIAPAIELSPEQRTVAKNFARVLQPSLTQTAVRDREGDVRFYSCGRPLGTFSCETSANHQVAVPVCGRRVEQGRRGAHVKAGL